MINWRYWGISKLEDFDYAWEERKTKAAEGFIFLRFTLGFHWRPKHWHYSATERYFGQWVKGVPLKTRTYCISCPILNFSVDL